MVPADFGRWPRGEMMVAAAQIFFMEAAPRWHNLRSVTSATAHANKASIGTPPGGPENRTGGRTANDRSRMLFAPCPNDSGPCRRGSAAFLRWQRRKFSTIRLQKKDCQSGNFRQNARPPEGEAPQVLNLKATRRWAPNFGQSGANRGCWSSSPRQRLSENHASRKRRVVFL